MVAPVEIFLYGDQSSEYHHLLPTVVKQSKQSCLLREFLGVSWTRLSNAIRDLPHFERSPFVAADFVELGERLHKSQPKSLPVSCVLQTVVQIGLTILHREREAQIWHSQQNVHVLGLCGGIIPAIAACIAQSTTDLVDIGSEFVLLTLRMGLAAAKRGTSIDLTDGPWSAVVSGVSRETLLTFIDDYHCLENTPKLQRVYISANSSSSLAVSGPPRVLQKFLTCMEATIPIRKFAIPVWGPFHAEHLLVPDIDQILSDSVLWERVVSPNSSLMFPGMTRRTDHALSVRVLLQDALHNIFQVPVVMEELCQNLEDKVGERPVRISLLGSERLRGLFSKLHVMTCCDLGGQEQNLNRQSRHAADINDAVAIVGMASKFPEAEDVEDLWKIIVEGRDLHRRIPSSRFDVQSHFDATGKVKNTTLTPYGCFYDNADKFDLALFRMSPREAAQTDPIQRLMLITAFMALESAGYYDPGRRRPRPKFGTYYGQAGDDYRQTNSSQDIDSNYVTGGIRAFGPGRISYHFGWEGPSMVVDTACSASGVAIHQAVSALRLRECDAALAGGGNFLSCSDMFAGLSRANFLSLTGGCKTLDEKADGYCRADGIATLVLKRLDDAIRDNDNVLGLIRGIGTNHAANAISITHPHAETQATLSKSVLRSAGLTMDDIDHVEMHGTGTQAGDVAEIDSIASLLEGKRRPDDHPLFLGAVKPNLGHSEAASGAASLMKGILMLRNQVIPRFTGIKTKLNPKLAPLEALNIRVPSENLPYQRTNRSNKRRMLINNFNATGGTTSLVLEEYDQARTIMTDPRDHFPITLSGATTKTLSVAIEALRHSLCQAPDTNLSHLSYTLTARRMHHTYRFSSTAATISELVGKLELAKATDVQSTRRTDAPVVTLVFTGQGSYYAGMGSLLWETCQTFRNHIKSTNSLSQKLGFPSFLSIIQNPKADLQQYDAVQSQLALVALELALVHLLNSWGVEATTVIGHSLGEYSALAISGVLSLADTLYLVGKRAQLMLEKCKPDYSMLAVAISEDDGQDAIAAIRLSSSTIACINGPAQIVISGPNNETKLLQDYFCQKSIKSTMLKTDYAFHSAQMDVILSDFKQVATSIQYQAPKIPIASTLLGTEIEAGAKGVFNAEYLVRQAREPVRFTQALRKSQEANATVRSHFWIELGPTSTCLAMVASTLGADAGHMASMLDKRKSDWQSSSDMLSKFYNNGGDVFWDEYHKEYLTCLKFISVPTYSFDMTSHFIPYEGDWAITKNQQPKVRRAPKHTLRSSTIHEVTDFTTDENGRSMHFVTDVLRDDFQVTMANFNVTNSFSDTTWLLTDMVVTAASYLRQYETATEAMPPIDIVQVASGEKLTEIFLSAKAVRLIATQEWSRSQIIEVTVTVEGPQDDYQSVHRVVFDDQNEWFKTVNKSSYLYQSRIDHFKAELQHSTTKAIESGSAVQILANDNLVETVATLRLGDNLDNFAIDPLWYEGIIGVINRISEHYAEGSMHAQYKFWGWRNLRLLRKLEPSATYHVHVKLQPTTGLEPILGDVHILNTNGQIVAVFEDVHYEQGRCLEVTSTTSSVPDSPVPGQSFEDSYIEDHEASLNDTGRTTPNTTSVSSPTQATFDFDHIIALLANEIGVEPSSIHEDSLFDELGIDSILQIAISARMKEYVQRDLPGSLLVEFPSVGKLRNYFE